MNGNYVIRVSQTGWLVYNAANPDNFHVFRSDEPERFVKFVAEKIGHVKVDQIVSARLAEIDAARKRMEAGR